MRTNAVLILLCLAVLAGGCSQMHAFAPGHGGPRGARLYRAHKVHAEDLDAAIELITELNYTGAVAKLKPLTTTFAKAGAASQAAEANFWLGYCREKLGNAEGAYKLYDLVARKYPDTPAARQAVARMTRLGF